MRLAFGLFTAAGALALLHCSSLPDTCHGAECEAVPDGSTTEGGTDGGADVVQPPVGCDPLADPKDASKCVVSEFGVFVDATGGSDGNAGTREQPVKSITSALGKLGGKARVYVCEGTYAEHVKLTSAVSLYGGFACGTWSYSGTKAKVAPADTGYALEVSKVTAAVLVEDLTFTAVAGTEAAPSSIAAFVNASPSVALKRVALEAKAGSKGKDQSKGAAGALMTSTPTAGTLNGNSGGATVGGLPQSCTCVGGGTSKGGGGGNDGANGSPGETAQATPEPPTATGAGQTSMDCGTAGPAAKIGSNAPSAAAAVATTKLGVLAETGWTAEGGQSGTGGGAGQGGGGGGGAGGGGGSGACGGCGGEGGKGGGGGGASIALVALNSPVAVSESILTTADAGAGGAGGQGGDGISGGIKGTQGGGACSGGNGGKGGNGGAGGGGAGGISVGALYKGTKPTLASTPATTGAFGQKGIGGAAGVNDGIDGQKADVLEAP